MLGNSFELAKLKEGNRFQLQQVIWVKQGMKELALEQPTIIIDETVDESYETSETA
ncbi:hypothetical protein HanRHA438_Chr08g0355741 [Helianthus annuus]|uniref:Uncharacterized protein n=1 Tax=Helianthus annuus TaxID=4232 RepID=A0A251U6C5_HELAN|nr:hypothetical protein HanPI659440_Chr08g0300641 [Helianthus annuus]KAJ0898342.1 hypothetical protein HanRHA438_Chr08g0355741 [Helianthus annuus]KAJ0902066.1 hypothetical protein HanPSC8_Chr08g0332651 [Helianthus annuus]